MSGRIRPESGGGEGREDGDTTGVSRSPGWEQRGVIPPRVDGVPET